jgi:hypothetical protein
MSTEQITAQSPRPWLPVAPGNLELVARVDLSRWLLPVDFRGGREQRGVRRMARLVLAARQARGAPLPGIGQLRCWHPEALQEDLRQTLEAIDTEGLGLPAFAVVHRRGGPDGAKDAAHVGVPSLERNLLRALAILSRVSGTVFVARRSPRVGALLAAEGELWLFAARPAAGKRARS